MTPRSAIDRWAAAKQLTRDEARRIAANIAKLPEIDHRPLRPSPRRARFTSKHRNQAAQRMSFQQTALAMIFKLGEAAEQSWRRLNGHNQLPKIILGVKFADGVEVPRTQASSRCRLTPAITKIWR